MISIHQRCAHSSYSQCTAGSVCGKIQMTHNDPKISSVSAFLVSALLKRARAHYLKIKNHFNK